MEFMFGASADHWVLLQKYSLGMCRKRVEIPCY